jgi:hypothetical protein
MGGNWHEVPLGPRHPAAGGSPSRAQGRKSCALGGVAAKANDLRKTARRQWRRPLATLSLGAAGASWLATGPLHDPVGGALALAGSILGLASAQPAATAYSYILDARHTFGSRAAQTRWSYHA